MRNIVEFLSSKNINKEFLPKNLTFEDYLEKVFIETFEEDKKGAQELIDEVKAIMENYKMEDNFRVLGNTNNVDKILQKYETNFAKPFMTMMTGEKFSSGNFTEEILEDVTNGYYDNMSEIRTDVMGYELYYSKNFIYVYGENDNGILFEYLDTDIEISPDIKTYNEGHTTYIELSHRPLVNELKIKNDDDYETIYDHFWNNYNEMCDDYIKIAQEKLENDFDLEENEIHIYGRQGKHVCIKPSFMLFHNYDAIMQMIDDLQDKLLKDAQDELDYLQEEINANKD